MKLGDKVILFGFIDGYSYETTGQTNFIIALETGERVEIPLGGTINVDDMTLKDNIKLKDVIARIKKLDLNTQKVWLDGILKEVGDDYGSMKYREGYDQGKFDGEWVGNQLKDADKIRQELNKPVIQQFVADWYEENKDDFEGNLFRCVHNIPSVFDGAKLNEFERWFLNASTKPFQTLVNMHQFGYEVEKEKKYKITLLNRNDGDLYLVNQNADLADKYGHFSPVVLLFTKCTNFSEKCYKLTKKEVVLYDFGWVFDCEGVEVQEVEG